jgi:hypothetical protein
MTAPADFPEVERLVRRSTAFRAIDSVVSIGSRAVSQSRVRRAARELLDRFLALERPVRIRIAAVFALSFAVTQVLLFAAMPENSAPPLLIVIWFLIVTGAIAIAGFRRWGSS